ncbi:endospore germination permease [Paenibacillus sp. GCM10023252]|uniref:GerAB/ArcD/ProY family transporter n=1 Tax=Paenibacillus sp. GCM10023252 TaxID=3252649 RepID=UPI00360F795D
MSLSSRQIYWLMVSMQIVMLVLLTASPAAMLAKQDAWMSAIGASLIGGAVAYMATRLSLLHPEQSFIQYTRTLLGGWAGSALSLLYLLYWLVVFSVILRQFASFINATILPQTPIAFVMFMMALAVVYPTMLGITVIGRLSEVLGPIILLGVIVPILLATNKMSPQFMLPLYGDSGLNAVFKGALPGATFLGDCFVLIMLISIVSKKEQVMRHAIGGVLTAGGGLVLTLVACTMIFGPTVIANEPYPLLMLVRSISVGGIIENLDAIVAAIWIMSIYIKLSLYLFAASYGTMQWTGRGNWRLYVPIYASIAILIGLLPRNYVEISIVFPQKLAIPYILPIQMVGIPLLLLIVALVRRRIAA